VKPGTHTKSLSTKVWLNPLTLEARHTAVKGWIKFDSIFESNIYLSLKKNFPRSTVLTQYPFNIVPSNPMDRYDKPLIWKCDFALEVPLLNKIIPIEVKGNWIESNHSAMSDFRKTLRLLDLFYPKEARELIIVSSKRPIAFDGYNTSIMPDELVGKVITTINP
jgi:hypothetical protein